MSTLDGDEILFYRTIAHDYKELGYHKWYENEVWIEDKRGNIYCFSFKWNDKTDIY